MARKRKTPGGSEPIKESRSAAVQKIMIEAPRSWVERLDRIAEGLGLSRSAYIRQACERAMRADEKD